MNREEALQILRQACSSVVADLGTHQRIQDALMAVEPPFTEPAMEPARPDKSK